MAKLNNFNNLDEFNVYILFHPEASVNFTAVSSELDQNMEDIFGDSQSRVFFSREHLEIIYRIKKPIMLSKHETLQFFESLRRVITDNEDLQPHFTQFKDGVKE